jgi:hypothetical protein
MLATIATMSDSERRWQEPNLGPTDVKRQHYVPEFLLRRFADSGGKLLVLDLDDGASFSTSVKNAAVEIGFNNLIVEDKPVSLEPWLTDIESSAAPIIESLVSDPRSLIGMSADQEMLLARFLTSLRFRTPRFRSSLDWNLGQVVPRIKESIEGQLRSGEVHAEADAIWAEWKDNPDWWWLGASVSPQPAESSASMLEEVQGFANLLRKMPWRLGQVPDSSSLYTSDNPMAAYFNPVRPWWLGASFTALDYHMALTPRLLLRVGRLPLEGGAGVPQGERVVRDFTVYQTAVSRHVITSDASRYLLGSGIKVPRDCAHNCLQRLGASNLEIAVNLQGFDPGPPSMAK